MPFVGVALGVRLELNKKNKRALIYSFIIDSVIILAFAILNLTSSPFGIDKVLNKWFHDIFNSVFSNIYYPEPHKDVTVLLLQDDVVQKDLNGRWPATYSFHGEVMKSLIMYKPKALFIDFLYLSNQSKPESESESELDLEDDCKKCFEDPNGKEYLAKVLKKYKDAGIPVYLSYTPEVQANLPGLDGLVEYVSSRTKTDATDFISREYPIMDYVDNKEHAAVAIYKKLNPEFKIRPNSEIDIFWGTKENKYINDEIEVKESFWDLANKGMEKYLSGFTQMDLKHSSYFSNTIFVRDIIRTSGNSPTVKARLEERLKDRVVLYGANLAGIRDNIYTPTRHVMPGVYYHAMALDNLMVWKNKYKSERPNIFFQSDLALLIWNLLPIILVVIPYLTIKHLIQANIRTYTGSNQTKTYLFNRFLDFIYYMHFKCSNSKFIDFITKFSISILISVFFMVWIAMEFYYFGISTTISGNYIQFFGLGYFVSKMGLIESIKPFIIKFGEKSEK